MRTGFAEEIDAMRIDVLQVIMASQNNDCADSPSDGKSLGVMSRKITEIQSAVADVPIHHRILRHLVFESMLARRDQTHVAEPDTCRWILEDDFSDGSNDSNIQDMEVQSCDFAEYRQLRVETEESDWKQMRQQILNWLKAGDSILHISGNAGSGKSTLMKYLHGHSTAKKELLVWAVDKKLVVGHFFFWIAGNTPQRTITGLYKSLLFQALSQCPELIEHVFSSQLARTKMRRGFKEVEAVEDFNDHHIREAFNLLVTRTEYIKHRFCFFIDGLDECIGSRLDHERLAVKLQS